MTGESDEVRRRIERIAWSQAGAISRRQLCDAGLSEAAVDVWLRNGRLRALWKGRGVYALGYAPLRREGQLHAALLLGGPRAVLCDRTAADVLELRRYQSARIHVAVPVKRAAAAGIVWHEVALDGADLLELDNGLRIVRPERVLLELAARGAVHEPLYQAMQLRLLDWEILRRMPGRGRRGSANLRTAIAAWDDRLLETRSRFERRALRYLLAADPPLPPFHVNHKLVTPLGTPEVDFYFPGERIAIELDGGGHDDEDGPRIAFVEDRRRDRGLGLIGVYPVRFTRGDLHTIVPVVRGLIETWSGRAAA